VFKMQTEIIWFLLAINGSALSCVYAALTRMSTWKRAM